MIYEPPSRPDSSDSAPFKRLGGFVYRRRKYIVVAWIIALVAVVPAVLNEGAVTSLQQGGASGNQLESVKASELISSQFARTVPTSTLLIVISGSNVTSPAAQDFISRVTTSLKTDRGIRGLNQTIDVYSPLYSAIKGTNRASFAALDGANGTTRLLLGVPALYIGAWRQAYASTQNVSEADTVALNTTARTLDSENATAFRLYSSHVLNLFDSAWRSSWSDPQLSNLTVIARATIAARTSGIQYTNAYRPQSRAFSSAVLNTISLSDFLSDTRAQANSRLSAFAVAFVSNSSGFSDKFVKTAFALGNTYTNSSVRSLAGDIVRRPTDFGVGRSLTTLITSLVSPAGDVILISLGLDRSSNQNIVAVRADVAAVELSTGHSSGIQTAQVTGEDAVSYDFGNSTQADLGLILPVTIVLLIVATGLFFRSFLTPFITLGTIGVALGISQVFIVLVGTYIAKVDFTIPTILLTILIGVGTDYSVFVVARFREERVKGASVQQAVETSVTWAGESIATSGATVIISFLALALTSVVFLQTIGYVVGLGVLVALLVALTLVPAIVSIVGGRTFWPNSGARFERYSISVLSKLEKKTGYFSRSGAFAVKRAKVLIILAIMVSVPSIYVYANTTPTYDFISAAPSSLESVAASNHLISAFGGGRLSPSYVVITFESPVVVSHTFNSADMATIGAVSSSIAASPDVRNVTSPTMPYGRPVDYKSINYSTSSGRQTFNAVVQSIGKDNKTVLVTLNFRIDPYSTAAISDAQSLRQRLHANFGSSQGVTGILLGGASGSILDTKNVFDSQFTAVVPIVAVGVALVLLVVLGSVFLPIFAVISVLMSIVWTLAATRLIFQQFYSYQILFIVPFFLFVTLLGLGMDYNVFILTRIREEATKGKHLDDAIVGAIEQTGGIITAAAIILAGSLGALMLSSDLLLKELGFSFAYSILIDALIVRTYLVPAVMSTVGRWNWYNPIPYIKRSQALYERERPG
ncbi:MAG TPA: MMPL family transporter [Nitrososphaerales archaeon]|nr:MMPL family transporter [Nitrososphaerales archaeon]